MASFLWFSQCTLLSFPELELKEKKEEEQEKGMTAAAAAAAAGETELADSQPQGEGRKDEEGGGEGRKKVGGGGRECCQRSEGRQGGEGTPPEDTAEAPRGKRIYGRVCRMQARSCECVFTHIHTHAHTHRAQNRQSKLCM